jgi:hypothetical protein
MYNFEQEEEDLRMNRADSRSLSRIFEIVLEMVMEVETAKRRFDSSNLINNYKDNI